MSGPIVDRPLAASDASRHIHFSIPLCDHPDDELPHSLTKSKFVSRSLRSISGTTCDAFDEEMIIMDDDDDEDDEISGSNEDHDQALVIKESPLVTTKMECNEGKLISRCVDHHHQMDHFDRSMELVNDEAFAMGGSLLSLTAADQSSVVLSRNEGSDEEAEALMMEAYLSSLVAKNVNLTPTALLGLRYDLTKLELSDLLGMLRTLFKMVELLECQNFAEMFQKLITIDLDQLLESETQKVTEPVREVLNALIKNIRPSKVGNDSLQSTMH